MAAKKKRALPKRPLIVLVGDSKAGKTTLSIGLLNIWQDRENPLAYLRTLTSRPRRPGDPTEDIVYEFTDRARILRLKREGKLVEFVDYGGNLYGVSEQEVWRVLAGGMGIIAATEHGLKDFQEAGLTVVPIKVLAKDRPGTKFPTDTQRQAEDEERARTFADYWSWVDNSFAQGGRAQALADLQFSVMKYLHAQR